MNWLQRRRAEAERRILGALSDGDWHYGEDLMQSTQLRPGRFGKSVARLMKAGTVETRHMDPEPGQTYRRLVYRLKEGET